MIISDLLSSASDKFNTVFTSFIKYYLANCDKFLGQDIGIMAIFEPHLNHDWLRRFIYRRSVWLVITWFIVIYILKHQIVLAELPKNVFQWFIRHVLRTSLLLFVVLLSTFRSILGRIIRNASKLMFICYTNRSTPIEALS